MGIEKNKAGDEAQIREQINSFVKAFSTRDMNLMISLFFLRLHATMMNGKKTDYWERLTFCFEKINGKWLIAHEHVSLPADLKTGKSVSDLKP